MKKIIFAVLVGILLTSATIPQFFYYNTTRKAIAVRDDQEGTMVIKNNSGQTVMTAQYPSNRSWWVSVNRLAPGLYTASTTDGGIITFYKRP